MKKTISLMLAIVMLLGTTVGVFAQGMSNFTRTKTYDETVFTDVPGNAWYAPNVANAYEYGLANGVGDGLFSPDGNVTVAQAITFAVRIYQIYYNGATAELPSTSGKWYDGYVDFAVANTIIENGIFTSYDDNATRAEIAYIFSRVLPNKEYSVINSEVTEIPDMRTTEKYYNEILKLFKAGIITGMDDEGNYYPEKNVTRAEITAIMDRIIDSSMRKLFVPPTVTTDQPVAPTDQPVATTAPPVEDIHMNAEQIAEKASNSVATVYVFDKNGKEFALGSGFFIEASGVLVTNYHVIEDAYDAVVYIAEQDKEYKVEKLLGCDEEKDIAILQVEAGTYQPLTLGDSDKIKSGQKVFVIGSPKGFVNTITEGIISNIRRENGAQILMQISASISSGNSGGPVLNDKCEVIGIATSSYVDETSQNLNFAVHSNLITTIDRSNPMTLADYQKMITPTAPPASAITYYAENSKIPDFGSITGYPVEYKEITDSGTVIYMYKNNYDALVLYIDTLEKTLGWKYDGDKIDGDTQYIYLTKGTEMVMIANAPGILGIVFAEESSSGNTTTQKVTYYAENPNVPDYTSVTGDPARARLVEDGIAGYGYDNNYSSLEKYVEYIQSVGWRWDDDEIEGSTQYIYFVKGSDLIMISNSPTMVGIYFNVK